MSINLPANGQTCANCAGDCCSAITFMGEYVPPLKDGILSFSVKELKLMGYVELYNSHKSCVEKMKKVCLIYDNRPKICRSYYCHGKYWRPK